MDQYSTLVDQTAAELRRRISEKELKPGERLPSERNLCVALRVGRTTVREALKSLAAQGFVIRTRRGAVVADPENVTRLGLDLASLAARVSIRELYEVRKLIEVRVAGWAAMRASPADIEAIRPTLEPESFRKEERSNPNTAFHDALARAAHNPALLQIYESGRGLFFRLPFFWKLFDDAEVKSVRAWRHELALRWHRHLFRAIEQHDPEEAEGAMFQHLDIMEKDLLARLQVEGSDPARNALHPHPMLAALELEPNSPVGAPSAEREKSRRIL